MEGWRERDESGNCYNIKEFGFVATVSSLCTPHSYPLESSL